jgi:signal transduction histidine kinase
MRFPAQPFFYGQPKLQWRLNPFTCRLLAILICCLSLVPGNAPAQEQSMSTVAPKKHLADLLEQYRGRMIRDTAYLNAVDSIAPLILSDDSLPSLLSAYRQVAFNDGKLGKYRAHYYTYLAIYSYNTNKFGSAIYYSERNNEEKVKAGIFEKGGIPHSDQFAITLYYNNRDYTRVFAKYDPLRPALLKMPAAIVSGKLSAEQAFVAFSILNAVVYSAYKVGDTARAGEGMMICRKMLENVQKQPKKYKVDLVFYSYVYHTLLYAREKYENHYNEACGLLQEAIREVRSAGFPAHLQAAYEEELYADAFDFYFDNKKRDSAQYYLGLVRNMNDSLVKFSSMRQNFLLESSTKLLAENGHFEAAYAELLKLYRMSDSSFYAVSSDRDNNLYALAEAENTRNELFNAEAKRQQAQKYSTILFFSFGLLVFGGGAWSFLYRSKQKQRLLNLQLNLARNFHDEIGPMLLYANILAKKEGEANTSAGLEELKIQLTYIMEAVRGISHDLKSSKLSTVNSFYADTVILLEKIKSSTQIDFRAGINNGGRVLSQLQYANLWKIVNELISNSVKHARCSLITLYVKATERDLRIEYADNGKGIARDLSAKGIGIQNMQERVNLLNGEFQLHNAYPKGYSIDISIPLA